MLVLVDSSVILDVATRDPNWFPWSSEQIREYANHGTLCINKIIYTEVSIGYEQLEEVEAALPPNLFRREPIPWAALFLAGKAFLTYRREGGPRLNPLPDFYIGAHAAVARLPLLTRDPRRIRHHFPEVRLIAPDT